MGEEGEYFARDYDDDVSDCEGDDKVFDDTDGAAKSLNESLTSLQWLQCLDLTSQRENAPPTPPSDTAAPPRTLKATKKSKKRPRPPPRVIDPKDIPLNPTPEDYRTNPNLKPPYSYARLIYMAIKEENKPLITLSAIYNFIKKNFKYYCFADCSWQNSVRHNLSLSKCFEKVPREKGDKGKGGFWRLAPGHEELFDGGVRRKRASHRSRSETSVGSEEGKEEGAAAKRLKRFHSDSTAGPKPRGRRPKLHRKATSLDTQFENFQDFDLSAGFCDPNEVWPMGMNPPEMIGMLSAPPKRPRSRSHSAQRSLNVQRSLPESPVTPTTSVDLNVDQLFEDLLDGNDVHLHRYSQIADESVMVQIAEGLMDFEVEGNAPATLPPLSITGVAIPTMPGVPLASPPQPPSTTRSGNV